MAEVDAATRESWEALFARARAADIVKVAESGKVTLARAGQRMRGECPICHASAGKKAGGAFSAEPKSGLWYCFGACSAGGDVVDLAARVWNVSLRQAAEDLAGEKFRAPVAPSTAEPVLGPAGGRTRGRSPSPDGGGPSARMATRLWRESAPLAGTLAETYLRSRGIDAAWIAGLGRDLRFHGAAFWGVDPATSEVIAAPAMIGRVRSPGGPTGGVHVTYLRRDGAGKARMTPAKKMWGPQVRDGRPGGLWLSDPRGDGPLVVAEGIESALSAAMLFAQAGPQRVVAALSLNRLQGGWRPDRWGRIDPGCVAADPDKPAFTWPEPPDAPWGEVVICVDRDMSPVDILQRKAMGGTWRAPVDADQRARLCGALAEQAWRAAGAAPVRVAAPGVGRDFNDELLARISS